MAEPSLERGVLSRSNTTDLHIVITGRTSDFFFHSLGTLPDPVCFGVGLGKIEWGRIRQDNAIQSTKTRGREAAGVSLFFFFLFSDTLLALNQANTWATWIQEKMDSFTLRC